MMWEAWENEQHRLLGQDKSGKTLTKPEEKKLMKSYLLRQRSIFAIKCENDFVDYFVANDRVCLN